MYPARDLKSLAELKAGLRRRIARRRLDGLRQFAQVSRPLHWADRAWAHWRRLGPLTRFAAGPLGVWLCGRLARRHRLAGRLLRWGPVLWSLARGFDRGRADRSTA